MTRRMWLTVMVMVGVVGVLGVFKVLQIQSAIAEASSFQPPPEAVTTLVARTQEWPASLSAIGTVTAVRGVTVSADLPGVVEAILFESGRPAREGEVLVRLDARQERAQLAAAEAQRELLRVSLDRVRGLVSQGILAQAELDRASAEHKQAEARVGEIRATIDRKQIRAPFSGELGIRQVNLGQYVAAGAPIVALQATDPVYVDFSVPQQDLRDLNVGGEIRIGGEAGPGDARVGRITAIDSVIDEATRNTRVRATLANRDGHLRPGMFVQAHATLGQRSDVVPLPASAIQYAPYGDSVFVVSDMKGPKGQPYRGVKQQFVKLGPARGDQVAVVSGLDPGTEVVTSGAFKLRNGAAVRVDNSVLPANNPAPRPENE